MSNKYEANPQLVIDNLLNEVANLQKRNAILSAIISQMELERKETQAQSDDE